MSDLIPLILEHWQIVFVYGLYELKQISKSIAAHSDRILILETKHGACAIR